MASTYPALMIRRAGRAMPIPHQGTILMDEDHLTKKISELITKGHAPVVTEKTRQEVLTVTGVDVKTIPGVSVVPSIERNETITLLCRRYEDEFPLQFADNVLTKCVSCGCGVQHRPEAPENSMKLCLDCVDRLSVSETN
jgi:hypothetical protein